MGDGWLTIALCFALAGCLQVSASDTAAATGGTAVGSAGGASSASAGSAAAGSAGGGSGSGTSGSGTTTGQTFSCDTVECNPGLICDPSDGKCKCTLGGPACGPTQLCDSAGDCVDDPCFGLVCTATGAACYYGVCKCGGPNGVECSTPGNSCSPIDNSCGPTASCLITPCAQPGTICNPNDPIGSQCRCGTEDGPVCKGESCYLWLADGGTLGPGEDAGGRSVYGQCGHHDPCFGVTCPPLETCDRNNFDPQTLVAKCECGGDPDYNIPGAVCASNETCLALQDGGPGQCVPQ